MLSKPSRSEIEKALSGSNALGQRRKNTTNSKKQNSQRAQQVIGGDLTGISERQKYGLLQRVLNSIEQARVISWLAGLVLLIAMVFFIRPQEPNSIKSELRNTISEQERAIYTTSRLDDQESSVQDSSFSRDNDVARATVFRQQDAIDKKIRELLSEAEKLIADGWYSLPLENNALMKYKQVLEVDERNASALQGLDYISGRFLAAGIEALGKNNEIGAINALDKLKTVNSESEQYYRLINEIDTWKEQQQIYSLIQQAQAKFASDELIQPARDNAFYYFLQALALDDTNEDALNGVKAITNQFMEKIKTAVSNDQLLEAQGYLETIRIISPDNQNISVLEKLIADTTAINKAKADTLKDSAVRQNSDSANDTPINAPLTPDIANGNTETLNNIDIAPLRENGSPTTTTRQPVSLQDTSPPRPVSISNTRTPQKEASEQQAFDKQYLSQGLKAYDNSAFESALALLKPLADKGVSQAQIRIANMIFAGQGVERNKQNAQLLAKNALPAIQKFADEGRPWAQTELANLYHVGLGLPRNTQDALKWYLTAANQGYPRAQAKLGIIYLRGNGVLANRRVATLWLQRAAKQGDKLAIKNLRSIGINY